MTEQPQNQSNNSNYRPPSQEAIEKLAEILDCESVKQAAEAIITATGCPREDAYYAIARDTAKKNS